MPRLLQSLMAALCDLYLFKLAKLLYGERVALWTLLCWTSCWFGFYSMPRTLANSMETVLLVFGLYYYSWPQYRLYQPSRHRYIYLHSVNAFICM